jgi:hypothetical protein
MDFCTGWALMPRVAVPVERKRKLGKPSHANPLPPVKYVVDQVTGIPEPLARLGPPGRATWDRLWTSGATWISGRTDIEWAQLLCECVDERAMLWLKVLADQDWRDRVGLRNLEHDIRAMYSLMGFNPVDRGKMGVGEVRPASVLDELRARRENR